MQLDDFRNFCLGLKGVTESLPFDENTLVFKVMDKMFALTDIADFQSINVKCEPEKAIELRERYQAVTAGYHMNKKHWNTIMIGEDMPDKEVLVWTLHSYELVVAKLPKKQQQALKDL
jgi:predicted DNA-binding protein (MmcQ/YjbR family)